MKILLLAAMAASAWGQAPDIETIMRRVALNQAKSQDLRTSYIYTQKQTLKMMRGNHKVAREEHREYTISPKARGIDRAMVHFDGKYETHNTFISYDKPGFQYKGTDVDGQILDSLAKDMMHDRNGRDGIASDLFPLTNHQQLKYNFSFVKEDEYRGRKIYRIHFEPKGKPSTEDDGACWRGDGIIDAEEYQPVSVTTSLAWKMPFLVKTLLGTNVHGVGFTVSYEKFADGIWFPVSYGGEFEVRAVFVYHRTIAIAMKNSDFRRMDVSSNVAYVIEDK